MSKIIATAAIRGAHKLVKQAEVLLLKAIKTKGENNVVLMLVISNIHWVFSWKCHVSCFYKQTSI